MIWENEIKMLKAIFLATVLLYFHVSFCAFFMIMCQQQFAWLVDHYINMMSAPVGFETLSVQINKSVWATVQSSMGILSAFSNPNIRNQRLWGSETFHNIIESCCSVEKSHVPLSKYSSYCKNTAFSHCKKNQTLRLLPMTWNLKLLKISTTY